MTVYKAPLDEIHFVLNSVFNIDEVYQQISTYSDFTADLRSAILEGAAKLAETVFLPINNTGDLEGCRFIPEGNQVDLPEGFKEAYLQFCTEGWSSLSASLDYGGQGAPFILKTCLDEMFASSNISLSMYAGLTNGAIEALDHYASDELKGRYLEKLINGTYTGTMCLTEAHCGSDLGLMKTKAIPDDQSGRYRVSGSKIWITGGEHDLSENIVHLVLARLPDAPSGSKGISLLLVPKFLEDGRRNTVFCTGLEHKMGINGSATCFISLEDAQGWLIGEPHQGLKYMFVMMNSARLMVGMQGLGLAETAYQTSLHFAKERKQGKSIESSQPHSGPIGILGHPDVRRMILSQKAFTEGARAFAYWVGMHHDLGQKADDPETRARCTRRVELMTPVVKAFLTDQGFISCDQAVQLMGGAGYTKDWGVEQLLRDCRIARIYEGTNGIQALDLIGRKLPANNGEAMFEFIEEMKSFISRNGNSTCNESLSAALSVLQEALMWLTKEGIQDRLQAASSATPFLRLFGLVILAYMWEKLAGAAECDMQSGKKSALLTSKIKSRDFYFSQILPEIETLMKTIKQGKTTLMQFDEGEL